MKRNVILGGSLAVVMLASSGAYALAGDANSSTLTADQTTPKQGPTASTTPAVKEKEQSVARLNQQILNNEMYIRPLEIVDTRCILDAPCQNPGTVEVRVAIKSETLGMQLATITLGTPSTFAGKTITLIKVTRSANIQDYQLTFSVKDVGT